MEPPISIISLLTVFMSVLAIYIVLKIIFKVYYQKHRRPWFYIGVSAIFLALSELIRFFYVTYSVIFINPVVTEGLVYSLVFISMSFLACGLLLEHLILKYYKGKFVKMKFVPVQEGTLGGELDINIDNSNSYLFIKKDRKFLIEQFAKATKIGFEGFFISENNPKEIRTKFNIQKTPIAWVNQLDEKINSGYLKEVLDENSDLVDPLHINDLVSYIDNFLEQSSNPIILIDMNTLFKMNSFYIVFEFLKYIDSRIKKFNGIGIMMLNSYSLKKTEIEELNEFLLKLE